MAVSDPPELISRSWYQNEGRVALMVHPLASATIFILAPKQVAAQGPSLFTGGDLQASRQPLIGEALLSQQQLGTALRPLIRVRAELPDTAESEDARRRAQSLFVGRASGGLFGLLAPRDHGPSAAKRRWRFSISRA